MRAAQPAIAIAEMAQVITPDGTVCRISGWNPVPGNASFAISIFRIG